MNAGRVLALRGGGLGLIFNSLHRAKGDHQAAHRSRQNLECLAMSDMSGVGLAQLVQEIKLASRSIEQVEARTN
jgi:hypothetical protein